MIYAVHILNKKFIKIGYSKSNESIERISSLQTGSPFEIKEIFTVDGTLRQEKELHKVLTSAFARIRLPMPPNEWYPGKHPFFIEFLENLKISPNHAIAFCDQYDKNVKQPGKKNLNIEPNFKWPDK